MVEYDINSLSEEIHQIYIEIKKQEKKLKYLKKRLNLLLDLNNEKKVTDKYGYVTVTTYSNPYLPGLSEEFNELSFDKQVEMCVTSDLLVPKFTLNTKEYIERIAKEETVIDQYVKERQTKSYLRIGLNKDINAEIKEIEDDEKLKHEKFAEESDLSLDDNKQPF
ncbi:hypothetical protein OAY26_00730 [Acidimicrobiia bacterium]|nr:hypothetical protein [Acidimicrobiia bacterium]